MFLMRARPRADHIVFATAGAIAAIALAVNLIVQPALASCLTLKDFAARVDPRYSRCAARLLRHYRL